MPLLILSSVAVTSNFAMMICIYKNNGVKRSMYFIFACIGLSNAISALLCFVAFVHPQSTVKNTFLELVAIDVVVIFLSFFQLQANLALAYDRYLAVTQPLQYKSDETLRKVKRNFLIATISTLVVACIAGVLSAIYQQSKAPLFVVGVARLITFALFIIIYSMLFKKYQKSQANIGHLSASGPGQSLAVQEARAKREMHLFSMCLGVTVSFIVLNLPIVIASGIYGMDDINERCDTKASIVTSICLCFDILNVAVDPLWYLFIERRRRSGSRPTNGNMATQQVSVATNHTVNQPTNQSINH